jgi:hypothetical protein
MSFRVATLLLALVATTFSAVADSWTTVRARLPDDLRSAIWNGKEYLAIGRRGILFSSPDGTRWQSSGLGPKVPVNRLLRISGEYLAVGDSGIYRTDDLSTWTKVSTPLDDIRDLANGGTNSVADGRDG